MSDDGRIRREGSLRASVALGSLVLLAAAVCAISALHRLDQVVTYRLGDMTLADPSDELRAKYRLSESVNSPIVVKVGADSQRLGIREGDWVWTPHRDARALKWELGYRHRFGGFMGVFFWPSEVNPSSEVRPLFSDKHRVYKPTVFTFRAYLAPNWIPEPVFLGLSYLVEAAIIVTVLLVNRKRSKLFLLWFVTFTGIVVATQMTAVSWLSGAVF